MKRLLLLWILPTILFAEVKFTLGTSAMGSFEDETIIALNDSLYGGLFWEISSNNLGIGMTYDVTFISEESQYDVVETDWWLGWDAALNFSYHLLGNDTILDPFLGYSLGVRSLNKLYYYSIIESGWEETEPGIYTYEKENSYEYRDSFETIAVYGQINAGLLLFLDTFFVGSEINYRVMEMDIFYYDKEAAINNPLSASIVMGFRF